MDQLVTTDQHIQNELKKFNISDAAIENLKAGYQLKIEGNEDREGYKRVKESRLIIKRYRVDIEKKRKELTADALKFKRAIDTEAARIEKELVPIEHYLQTQEISYEKELERVKEEKEREEQIKFHQRISQLDQLGVKLSSDGKFYCSDLKIEPSIKIEIENIRDVSDGRFDGLLKFAAECFKVKLQIEAETKRRLRELEEEKEKANETERRKVAEQMKREEEEFAQKVFELERREEIIRRKEAEMRAAEEERKKIDLHTKQPDHAPWLTEEQLKIHPIDFDKKNEPIQVILDSSQRTADLVSGETVKIDFEKLEKCCAENPDLPPEFVEEILASKDQDKSLAEPFDFDKKIWDESFTESMDGKIWAEAFCEIYHSDPTPSVDEGFMTAWFCNAIMRGFDEACKRKNEKLEKCLEFIKWINSDSKKIGNLFNLVNMSLEDQVCTKSTSLDNITMRAEGLLMELGELDDSQSNNEL